MHWPRMCFDCKKWRNNTLKGWFCRWFHKTACIMLDCEENYER